MEDNPALTPQVQGAVRAQLQRRLLPAVCVGEWVAAQGRVYDFFDESWARPVPVGGMERWCISCDYGTVNPTSLGLWGLRDGVWYRVAESYYDARAEGRQRTDGEHADALERLAGDGPSGRWWPTRRRPALSRPCAGGDGGWKRPTTTCWPVSGTTAELLRRGRLVICQGCADTLREFTLYCWDEKAGGDRVKKSTTTPWTTSAILPPVLRRESGGTLEACVWSRGRF